MKIKLLLLALLSVLSMEAISVRRRARRPRPQEPIVLQEQRVLPEETLLEDNERNILLQLIEIMGRFSSVLQAVIDDCDQPNFAFETIRAEMIYNEIRIYRQALIDFQRGEDRVTEAEDLLLIQRFFEVYDQNIYEWRDLIHEAGAIYTKQSDGICGKILNCLDCLYRWGK